MLHSLLDRTSQKFVAFLASIGYNSGISMSTKSQTNFTVKYDGPALKDHSMSAVDLGPALYALGSLCQESTRALTGEETKVDVQVKAIGKGSFEIDLMFLLDHAIAATPLLMEAGHPTAKDILAFISELLHFSKRKEGKPIVEQKKISNKTGGDDYEVALAGDENMLIVNKGVMILNGNYYVRNAEKGCMDPLLLKGVDKFSMRDDKDQPLVEVTEEEVTDGYFDVIPEEVGLSSNLTPPHVLPAFLSLLSPVFRPGRKWQFYYGSQKIFALILDKKFNDRVFGKGERFGVGDGFMVDLRITQNWLPNGNVRNDYEIVEVKDTRPGPKPQELPLTP